MYNSEPKITIKVKTKVMGKDVELPEMTIDEARTLQSVLSDMLGLNVPVDYPIPNPPWSPNDTGNPPLPIYPVITYCSTPPMQ